MFRLLALTIALAAFSTLACAEEALRWTDSSGVIHYTNDPSRAPAGAEQVTTTIGLVPFPSLGRSNGAASADAGGTQVARAGGRPAGGGCGCGFGGAYTVVLNNPHDLADQVKQANMLDALGVSWRNGCCQ